MPRKPLFRTKHLPYHLTARSNNREWFHLPTFDCWQIFDEKIDRTCEKYGLLIYNFVLMSNHFHLIASTPNGNIDHAMLYLMREVSKQIGREAGRKNHAFGGPYNWCVIDNPVYFAHAYKYIYRNPVEGGLCNRVEEYDFSTLRTEMGYAQNFYDLHTFRDSFYNHIPKDIDERLAWLNRQTPPARKELIRRALRRKTFAFSKQRNHQNMVSALLQPEY